MELYGEQALIMMGNLDLIVCYPGTQWNSVNTGHFYALATKTNGTLWVWGNNQFGYLGQNNKADYSSPIQIPGTQWIDVAHADYTFMARKSV